MTTERAEPPDDNDPNVCVFCAAGGCLDASVEHGQECPFVTGMWPVDAEMAQREADCAACGERFREGEMYAEVSAASWPIDGFANNVVAEWQAMGNVTVGLCLPCAAAGRTVGAGGHDA